MPQSNNLAQQLTAELWKEVFCDEDEFLWLYFNEVYSPNEVMLITNYATPQVIAHIGFPSYLFKYGNKWLKAGYLSGVATQVNARGKGYAERLLRATHVTLWQRGASLAFLIPQESWLYNYYSKKGDYFTVAKARTIRIANPNFSLNTPQLFQNDLVWRNNNKTPQLFIPYKLWQVAYKSALLVNGGAILMPNNSVLFTEKSEKVPSQWVAQLPEYSNHFPEGILSEAYPFGMLRLINIPKVMDLYAKLHPTLTWKFSLLDKHIPFNSGNYLVKHGTLKFHKSTPGEPQYTPCSLGLKLFPEANLFFDKVLAPIPEPQE